MTVAKSNLVGWWRCDEIAGNTVFDYSGSDMHGFASGAMPPSPSLDTPASVPWSRSRHFQNNGYVIVNAAVATAAPITITGWVKPDVGVKSNYVILSLDNVSSASNDMGLVFSPATDNSGETYIRTRLENVGGVVINGLVMNQWNFVAGTIDEDGSGTLRINGSTASGIAQNSSFSSGINRTVLGARSNAVNILGQLFRGFLSDLRVYDAVLSNDEIEMIWNGDFWLKKIMTNHECFI